MAEYFPRFVEDQKGVIVDLKRNGDSVISSPVSGNALLSHRLLTQSMTLGSFVSYDARLDPVKNQWISENVEYLGEELEIVPYLLRKTKLQLRVYAVVCRWDKRTRSAWLWNDAIGRIHVPPVYFRDTLQPFDVVNVIAMYDGKHEDVPWTGVNITDCKLTSGASKWIDAKREQVTRMLHTSDGWMVSWQKPHANNVGFFSVLTNVHTGESAFAAWTDYTKGEELPAIGTVFRVTTFKQTFCGKRDVRAVLVTPFGKDGKLIPDHPLSFTANSRQPIQMIPAPPVHQMKYGRSKCDSYGSYASSESMMSMSSTQSEMEIMVDSPRLHHFPMAYHSGASTASLLSPTPSNDFMPIFIDPIFATWNPTEEEKNRPHSH